MKNQTTQKNEERKNKAMQIIKTTMGVAAAITCSVLTIIVVKKVGLKLTLNHIEKEYADEIDAINDACEQCVTATHC